MHYQVSADDYFARIRRLSDCKAVDLHGEEAKLMQRNIAALESIDREHLGTRPSTSFCKSFDHMCSGYYSD
jgi:hypothetical protein